MLPGETGRQVPRAQEDGGSANPCDFGDHDNIDYDSESSSCNSFGLRGVDELEQYESSSCKPFNLGSVNELE